MGTLFYSSDGVGIPVADATLAHLKVIIVTKLRRSESFTLSWDHADSASGGRSSVWLHPAIPLRFDFDEVEPPVLNPRWLEELADAAQTSGGISLAAERLTGVPLSTTKEKS